MKNLDPKREYPADMLDEYLESSSNEGFELYHAKKYTNEKFMMLTIGLIAFFIGYFVLSFFF